MASVGDLADAVGVDEREIAFLETASAAERAAFVAAVREAAAARDEELRDAVDRALGFVPRPLRGRVMKMLGAR